MSIEMVTEDGGGNRGHMQRGSIATVQISHALCVRESLQKGCTHVIKRHQNALSKKVAGHFQYFCIELNWSDIVFCKSNE